MKPTDFAKHLSNYLVNYLPRQRNASTNTIKSYRDTFSLFLRYCHEHHAIAPERMRIENVTPDIVLAFLDHLENERRCKSRTRNQRLAAIQAFFRFLQSEAPDHIARCQQIMAIPSHRYQRSSVPYLNVAQLQLILAQPDLGRPDGRRHAVMLRTLYDSGARVQELCDLAARDVRLESPASIQLTGKGRKTRIVPLMKTTVDMLTTYMQHDGLLNVVRENDPLFSNRLGHRLTRSGVSYLITKYANTARQHDAGFPEQTSPHTFRHTKAMHLLQAGNALTVIQAILGHVDIKTCGIYATADLEMKRRAMEQAEPNGPKSPQAPWQNDQQILDWLKSL